MKAFLTAQARRIDGLSLRERVMMFTSVAVTLVAVVDLLVLSPMLAQQRALTGEMQRRSADLAALRARTGANEGAGGDTPHRQQHDELAQLRTQTASLAEQIAERSARSADAARLAQLLEHVLRRHERLVLVNLATNPPAAQDGAAGRPALHTVNLSVSGAFEDLRRFVAELERVLPGLRWSELRLARDGSASLLSVRVRLLGDP